MLGAEQTLHIRLMLRALAYLARHRDACKLAEFAPHRHAMLCGTKKAQNITTATTRAVPGTKR